MSVKECILNLVLFVVVVFAVYVIIDQVYNLQAYSCETIATGIGYNFDYSLITGCRIEVEPNKWIPIESYRYFGDD